MDEKRDLLEAYSGLNHVESSLIWEPKVGQKGEKKNEMIIILRRSRSKFLRWVL